MRRPFLTLAAGCAFALASTHLVRADETGGTVGLSLAPLIGSHVETGLVVHPAPIPIPIVQIAGRYRNIEIFAESLPGSPDIAESGDAGQLATRLAFLESVVRVYDPADRVWIGGGEIVYNQSSSYVLGGVPNTANDRLVVSTSRVVGARYELGAGLTRDPRIVRLWLDVMPTLTGVNRQALRDFTFSLPERGSQFEAQLAVTNAHGPFSFAYGVRYLNYVAHYTRTQAPADRNTGFLPYATFTLRLGPLAQRS